MRDNRELYKAAFSKLHASAELSCFDMVEYRPHRKLRKSAVICLAACILLVATTASFAMTGESPMEFFKSFFKNDSGRLPDELNESYVLVGDQSVTYENRTITFEGYSYTSDTLLAKFLVEDMESADEESVNEFARRLRFELGSAGSLTMDWDSAPDGGVIIAVRMNLYDRQNDDTGTSAEDTRIIVWDREAGRESPVGFFAVVQPSSVSQITLNQDQLKIPDCKKVIISGLRIKLYFDNSIAEEEQAPIQTISLKLKDGTALNLYERASGVNSEIASDVSFSWSVDEDSCLSIGFSRALTTGEIAAVIINGAGYPVEG